MAEVTFSRSASPQYLNLVWEEFFRSRQRGLALGTHFPWMSRPSPGVCYAELAEGGELAGGLVLKDCSGLLRGDGRRAACIGLVCVKAEQRGRGLSRVLLAQAIERGREEGFGALTLWTGKWGVYEPLGFTLQDPALFGWVENPPGRSAGVPSGADLEPAPGLPVPPFARDVAVLTGPGAACTLIRDAAGPIVADYRGDPDAAAGLLRRALPGHWRLNTFRDDPLLAALARAGMTADLRPAGLQMWLPLGDPLEPREWARLGRFTVLDRI